MKQSENKDAAYLKAVQIAEEILPNGPIGVRMAKLAVDKGLQVNIEYKICILYIYFFYVVSG